MSKKASKPCNICKGKSRIKCMICGWKGEKKRLNDLPLPEQAVIRGIRNRREFLHQLDSSSTRAGNCSVNDSDDPELVEIANKIDGHIANHREWALAITARHESGKSIKSIADAEQLTVGQVKQIIHYTRDKLSAGIMEIRPRNPVKVNILPPEPLFYPGEKKEPIRWEEVPEDDVL